MLPVFVADPRQAIVQAKHDIIGLTKLQLRYTFNEMEQRQQYCKVRDSCAKVQRWTCTQNGNLAAIFTCPSWNHEELCNVTLNRAGHRVLPEDC